MPSQTYSVIERVSISSSGDQGTGTQNRYNAYYQSDISGDGRYVVFSTDAAGLVAGDLNSRLDVYLHDRQTETTTLISKALGTAAADGDSYSPSISANGRYIAFYSNAPDIAAQGIPYTGLPSVYVHDRQTGITKRIAEDTIEAPGNGTNGNRPSISSDGRYVAYETGGGMFFGGPGSGKVHVYDQQTGISTEIDAGRAPLISDDGRYIAYQEYFSGYGGIKLRDQQTGNTTLITDVDEVFGLRDLSADGRYLLFGSSSANLVVGDTNDLYDVFVFDRETGQTSLVSVDSNGNQANNNSFTPTISADGRYVAFHSLASNLVEEDNNNQRDVFVHDRWTGKTRIISTGIDGEEGTERSFEAQISANGQFVSFASDATNLVSGDTNLSRDIFVARIQNFPPSVLDFNQDGHTDILWRNRITGENAYWEMNGSSFVNAVSLDSVPASSGWDIAGVTDFTNDGKIDLLWRNTITGENAFWEMNGTTIANVTAIDTVHPSSGWDVVGVADFTNDGQTDILWRNRISGENAYWEMNSTTIANVGMLETVAASSGWTIAGVGDFTKDGSTDILWRNRNTGENAYWQMSGGVYVDVQAIETVAPSSGWEITGVGDYNQDGNADIIWQNTISGEGGIWRMNGATILGVDSIFTVAPSSGWAIV